jgi:hypothetical protein
VTGTPRVWAFHDTRGRGSAKPSGCGWIRITLPLDQLAVHGWRTGYACALPPEEWGEVDVFVAQRSDQPQFRPVWDVLCGIEGLKCVYEIDDDPFSLDPVNWLASPSYTNQDILDSIAHMASTAHLVTVTTDALADRFRQFNPNIAVLPNYIPAAVLALPRRRHEQLTIGYTCGCSHSRDIALIAQAWRDIVDETGCRGHFVGTDFRTVTRPRGFDFTGWEPEPPAYYANIDFDIGLAPLSDHPFGLGKSPLKALEYAALGIPVIASDHPVYREFVVDGVTGILCRTQDQWRDAMRLLLADAELRESMGAKGREQAAAWTIEGNWERWARVYCELMKGNG